MQATAELVFTIVGSIMFVAIFILIALMIIASLIEFIDYKIKGGK